MSQKTPDYLYEKSNIVRLILFTAVFAVGFINIYQPFGFTEWFKVKESQLLYSSLIMLTGVLVVVISRIIMYYHCKKHELALVYYGVWVLAEILAMSSFYALFEVLVLHDPRNLDALIKVSATNTSLVILLPYSILWLYFSWTDKKKRLEEIDQEEHQPAPAKKGMLSFHDEKGELKLSVQSDQLLYLESADNYVKIHFLSKGKITHFMLRNSLKNLDESLANTSMIRCHRSYVVNFDKVKVLRKEKDGIYLAMDEENIPDIPVSKTYTDRVMAKFALYSV
jgi:DNA-binding LytR/AlgR family response regulator